jgi:chromosomal replication initiation ATPase DnaA
MLASDLMRLIVSKFGVSVPELLSTQRSNRIMRARLAAYKVFHERGTSMTQIGRRLNRDHATVSHGIRSANRLIENDAAFRQVVAELIAARAVPVEKETCNV